ncbi:MAG: anaerobic glycerol-3-phosphate dehydrogenase subunit B [Caldilineaceae bacterium]|nr:anaerobic glycerol-3-phosphate dehydrogenase subunit B [Caldilineaceae bacterium]
MLDLLVIGAGLTGLFAAYTAARAGLHVRVIAHGAGATHWHAGTVDLIGYLPNKEEAVTDWTQALPELPPAHPYRILGNEAVAIAMNEFQRLTAAAGLPYVRAGTAIDLTASSQQDERISQRSDSDEQVNDPNLGRNYQLISPVGAPRPVYLAPAAQQAANLEVDRPMVIIGLEGMPDFYPDLIAENLQRQGHRARSATVPLSRVTKRRDNNPLHIARLLDQPATQDHLTQMVVDVTAADERVGLPAILGLYSHLPLLKKIHQAIVNRGPETTQSCGGQGSGCSAFEIPTLPPSVPGLRLDAALRTQLTSLGVRVEIGMEVRGFHATGRRIQWIETETGSRPLRHTARNYLLATGGILGGGIYADRCGRVGETVFDLPLTAPQSRTQWLRPLFLDRRGHPIFQAGVSVDQRLRPLDQAGAPVYDNLWAAGSTLAHTDPIRERSREGIAIATGYTAANEVVKYQ